MVAKPLIDNPSRLRKNPVCLVYLVHLVYLVGFVA
jgi:hypothetical protein